VENLAEILQTQSNNEIPVLIDPEGLICAQYKPAVLIDARMLKHSPEGHPFKSLLTIGLGPGYRAPKNCDVVIETKRGHTLGRVIREGSALPDSREPDPVMGISSKRVLRAPADGVVTGLVPIGKLVSKGQIIARIGKHTVTAPFNGALRGLLHDGLVVQAGDKIADVDPRGEPAYCFAISDKALAIGGGVLEAIFSTPTIWAHLKAELA